MTASRFSLPQIETWSGTLRTVFVNIGFFAAILMLIPAVASQMSGNAVVIDPIAVPQSLSDRGITPEVAANRLWDGLQDVAQDASTARATLVAVPNSRLVRFSLPDTGISVDSLFKHVRQFFGVYETHIGGEIICDTADCAPAGQRLRLRVIRGTSEVIDLPPIGTQSEPAYFREAATGVFQVLDPFVAIAARAIDDPERATLLARQLAVSGHPDARWAHNLLGDIARANGDPAAAIADYQAALALDSGFTLARIGLARALAETGDLAGAEAAIATVEASQPQARALPEARAEIAMAAGNREEAILRYLEAAEWSPLDPAPLTRAGELELALERTEDGKAHLQQALDLDPGYSDALRLLGQAYRAEGDLEAANRLFQAWIDYVPTSPDARMALAQVLIDDGNDAGALAQYDELVRLDPGNIGKAFARARVQLRLALYPQAVDGLLPFADGEQPDSAAVLLLAEIQQAAGKPDRALARYEQFLALDPDAPQRADVEAIMATLR